MSSVTLDSSRPAKGMIIASWAIRIPLAAAFLAAGGAKLAGVPMMVEIFDGIGIGQWFRYVTGTIEVMSAILLLLPATRILAAALLACTTVGAIFTHLVLIGGPAAPAAVLLVLSLVVLWLHRAEIGNPRASLRG